MFSQRSIGKLERLLTRLFWRDYETAPLLSRSEYRRQLYEAEVPQAVLERIEDAHRWEPRSFLPRLHEGWIVSFVLHSDGLSDIQPSEQDRALSQRLLRTFMTVALNNSLSLPDHIPDAIEMGRELVSSIELDGYAYSGDKVLPAAMKGVNLAAEESYLASLIRKLNPPNIDEVLFHYKESEEAYANGIWASSSAQARNLFVALLRGLREVATNRKLAPYLQVKTGDQNLFNNFVEVKLLSEIEKEAMFHVWVLLGESGSHPGIQESERARLTRLHVLVMGQWLCLRALGWK